jgi:hypothetical protein
MKTLRLSLAAAILAGCAVAQPPTASGVTPQPARPGHAWMAPDAGKKAALLYVSDAAANAVYVYDYANATLEGTLTGFSGPGGQCVDKQGDVFIVNTGNYTTVEYAHGGTTVINTYDDSTDAVGCSIDKKGDLAITNMDPGEVTVFPDGKGSGTSYSDADCGFMWPAGYDDKGNLYAEGEHDGIAVCELPSGATAMSTVSVSGIFINFPGSVQWDGRYITLTDQEYLGLYNTALYRMQESPSGGLTYLAATELLASCNGNYTEVLEPYIVGKRNAPVNDKLGKRLLGGNAQCSYAGVNVWPYPNGGQPTTSFGDYDVNGLSVSFKP